MPQRDVLILTARGERFRFYYDSGDTTVLHITVRHGVTPADAIRTYIDGRNLGWSEEHSRFETHSDTHRLLWARHSYDHSVIVISCLKHGDT
jgi:hypothetical protein